MKIVLASSSPRRKELLQKAGYVFDVCPSPDKEEHPSLPPDELVAQLSLQKARSVASAQHDALVIGADTVVAFCGEIFGKPKDEDEAVEMLSRMSGKWHTVYTGVTIVNTNDNSEDTFVESSQVKFNPLTQEKIEYYVDTVQPYDRAGAYGIQDGNIVETYEGSYSNIMGLPMEALTKKLIRFGVNNGND